MTLFNLVYTSRVIAESQFIVVGEGHGTPLQYFCPENPMDGGACQAAVHEVAKSRTRLSDNFTFPKCFQSEAVVNNAVVYIQVFVQKLIFISLG